MHIGTWGRHPNALKALAKATRNVNGVNFVYDFVYFLYCVYRPMELQAVRSALLPTYALSTSILGGTASAPLAKNALQARMCEAWTELNGIQILAITLGIRPNPPLLSDCSPIHLSPVCFCYLQSETLGVSVLGTSRRPCRTAG